MNKRLKIIRNSQNLTMEKFGNRIGVTKAAISKLEKGERNFTEQMIKSICREFEINEDWFRYGIGEMKTPLNRKQQIAQFTADIFKSEENSFKSRLVEALASLDEKEWEILDSIVEKISQNKGKI